MFHQLIVQQHLRRFANIKKSIRYYLPCIWSRPVKSGGLHELGPPKLKYIVVQYTWKLFLLHWFVLLSTLRFLKRPAYEILMPRKTFRANNTD